MDSWESVVSILKILHKNLKMGNSSVQLFMSFGSTPQFAHEKFSEHILCYVDKFWTKFCLIF